MSLEKHFGQGINIKSLSTETPKVEKDEFQNFLETIPKEYQDKLRLNAENNAQGLGELVEGLYVVNYNLFRKIEDLMAYHSYCQFLKKDKYSSQKLKIKDSVLDKAFDYAFRPSEHKPENNQFLKYCRIINPQSIERLYQKPRFQEVWNEKEKYLRKFAQILKGGHGEIDSFIDRYATMKTIRPEWDLPLDDELLEIIDKFASKLDIKAGDHYYGLSILANLKITGYPKNYSIDSSYWPEIYKKCSHFIKERSLNDSMAVNYLLNIKIMQAKKTIMTERGIETDNKTEDFLNESPLPVKRKF